MYIGFFHYDFQLIDEAQKWARVLAENNNGDLEHHTDGYGQNLAAYCCNADPSVASGNSVQDWYNEAPCYNGENDNSNFGAYGKWDTFLRVEWVY